MKRFEGRKALSVLTDGFILGDYYAAGATLELDYRQAREFLIEGRLALPDADSKAARPKEPAAKEG